MSYRALHSASLCNGTLPKSALWRFVTVFGTDSLSETERCIATRQNKMATPDVVTSGFKKLHFYYFFVVLVVVVLGRSALCINDHRTQNQSLKQARSLFKRNYQFENRVILADILKSAPIKRTVA